MMTILVACAACMGTSATFEDAEFMQGVYASATDCDFWCRDGESDWDGTGLFDEYMEVDGTKYPALGEENFIALPVRTSVGEKFTPVVVAGMTPSANVKLQVLADAAMYAKFIAQADDWATVNCAIEDEYATGVAIEPIAVAAAGGSLPTVKVTGLPTGLKYTMKLVTAKVTTGTGKSRVTTLVTNALPNTIYGTATKPGTYVVTAKLTNTTVKKALERKFTIVVDNLTGANDVLVCTDADGNDVGLANDSDEKYMLTVGVSELSLPRKIVATSGTVKVTGLPAQARRI